VVALAFGAEDYTRDTGAKRTWESLLFPRFQVLLAAKAAGIQALDTIYPDVEDEAGLVEETRRIVEMGFDGKGTIHPGQIPVIHRCFRPTPEDIEHAKKVIAAIEEARKAGEGTATVDGRMVDLPVETKARRVLKLAELYK
jgi:citrate lyase subunit beta/citryl-CoA lyase